ncbi:MAG: hypothetical protein KDK51_09010 [Deltaproteobacteria bacterium]|nr:hypothetical protein [Deltaproteobacteria bacterium]
MKSSLIQRLLQKDVTLWSDQKSIQNEVHDRLGWLDIPSFFSDKINSIEAFERDIKHTHIVLLGMGGSSLVSEVFLQSMESSQIKRHFHVVDTTDPQVISDLTHNLPLEQTLFIVASKSGTTLEVTSLFQYFWSLVKSPSQFIAITDEGTELHQKALELDFLRIWINPSTIGGRFAALSYFGLIPFALMGGDLKKLWSSLMQALPQLQSEDSPALSLAQQLYQAHSKGIHKLTLQSTQATNGLPLWVEQLVAESTGKANKGFLPILQDHGQTPPQDSYIHAFGFADELDENMTVHSVSVFNEVEDLAAEFMLWQMATALLGSMLKINPFDQPHVSTTKKNTVSYLQHETPAQSIAQQIRSVMVAPEKINDYMNDLKPSEVVCILSYLPQTDTAQDKLDSLVNRIAQHTPNLTLNVGPRYLHSTGQFHKGGKNVGKYIILTQDQDNAPRVPDENYDFNTLKIAQALGDYEALQNNNRKVILVHNL